MIAQAIDKEMITSHYRKLGLSELFTFILMSKNKFKKFYNKNKR